ncbi:hypothetical protein PANO111632_03520 [Paracoccus nototheniae]|uniref:Uncharacterized protein n=1 Tax=Paracoccus nototheniae TaxID=2489002 RepID=A0ABW4DR39_9RHOB|nr:hypothetical protein [Paracoccus nototheniae]
MTTPNESPAMQSAASAAARLFRAYEAHSVAPGPDTLFHTLTAMHSLDDRLKKAEVQDFKHLEEFTALKALRNFAHHQDEIDANVRVIPSPAVSDLAFLCLVRRDQVEQAIETVDEKWRAKTRAACESRFHWYGEAVNINPCLFNFMVHAYEQLVAVGVTPDPASVEAFETSYQFEASEGHAHLIDGRMAGPMGAIEQMLTTIVANLPSR